MTKRVSAEAPQLRRTNRWVITGLFDWILTATTLGSVSSTALSDEYLLTFDVLVAFDDFLVRYFLEALLAGMMTRSMP